MKAEELMIGDWVKYDKRLYRVSSTDDLMHSVCITADDIAYSVYPERYIQPIPLTKEILEQNGFELDHCEYYMELKNGPYTIFELEPYHVPNEEGKFEFYGWSVLSHFRMIIRYVHELQHLYKLMNTQLDKQEILNNGIKLNEDLA